MPNITKRLVDALESSAKDYILWDDKLTGFGVKVTPKTKKVYLLKCRMKNGQQRKFTLGVHGRITCEQGRKLAQDYLYQISQGIDPEEAYKKPADLTLAELCDKYFNDYALIHKKPSSIKNNRTYIERYIKPHIGGLMVSAVTRTDIIEFHKQLKDSPIQANRVVKMLSKGLFTCRRMGVASRE